MKLNSVMDREFRSRMRTWRSAATITAYLAVLGLITLAFLWLNTRGRYVISYRLGMELYMVMAVVQFGLIAFVTPALTSGAITGEKERQTLDLLLVTKLSARSIVLGKLVASLSYLLLLVFSSLPLFSLVFLLGGVAPSEILLTFGIYIFTAVYLGSIGLFYSAVSRRTQVATVLTYLTVLFLGIGTYMIGGFARAIYRYQVAYNVQFQTLPFVFHFNPLTPLLLTLKNGWGKRVLWEIGQVSQGNFTPTLDWEVLGVTLGVQLAIIIVLLWVATKAITPVGRGKLGLPVFKRTLRGGRSGGIQEGA
ncbi:ABC transporter permease [Calderihabitans maritimus]|uniref:ABC transporter permease n=1 Tax=Calderihabitans maritimus TaxID=1246530 RepID=A0A1Z5HR87_9FIRM|nr:ABC transporter permease [Calderihabitans maritimus]GAW91877.1 hypothetical protein Mahau_1544 [Calderihabitans maritimus]